MYPGKVKILQGTECRYQRLLNSQHFTGLGPNSVHFEFDSDIVHTSVDPCAGEPRDPLETMSCEIYLSKAEVAAMKENALGVFQP